MTDGKPIEATRKIELEQFIERSHEALRHQSQGHPEPFLALWSHADDVTIMAAIGGYQSGFAADHESDAAGYADHCGCELAG